MGTTLDLGVVLGQRQAVSAPASHESAEDTALVAAARDGDRAAFGHLYDRYARMVHGILLARVPYGEVTDVVNSSGEIFTCDLHRNQVWIVDRAN